MSDELDEEEDDDYDDDQDTYEWCASGESCALCDALDGLTFTSPPPVPIHPRCNCEVRPNRRSPPQFTNCENTWPNPYFLAEWTGGYPGHLADHLIVHVTIEITCWDGTTITDSIDLDFGIDPGASGRPAFADEVWIAVFDHVEELAATTCPACQRTPIPIS